MEIQEDIVGTIKKGLFILELRKSLVRFIRTLISLLNDYQHFFYTAYTELKLMPINGKKTGSQENNRFDYIRPLTFLGIAIGFVSLRLMNYGLSLQSL